MAIIVPLCTGCRKRPDQLPEYVDAGKANDMEPEEFVIAEEGTYNRENGHFLCTECYITAGMPSRPGGWICP